MKIRPSLSLPPFFLRTASAFSVVPPKKTIPCSKRPRLSVEAISILERLSLFCGPFLYDLHKSYYVSLYPVELENELLMEPPY